MIMSIASEIQRLQQAKADIYRALSRRGIHIPSDSTVDEYAAIIDPITSGETITYLDNPQGYLSFKFVTDGTVKWQNVKGDIEYSKNGGSTWTAFNGTTVSATTGDEIWFKGSLTGGCGASSESGSSKFYTSGYFFASGNIQSLCSFNNTLQGYHFAYLFSKCSSLNVDENNKLLLPATTLQSGCYNSMFRDCTSLTTAPKLPATTLATYCYQYMFYGCTSLTAAPELLATTLADYCYQYMFYGCTSLTAAPELPATTLQSGCYSYMFQGCKRLNYIKAMFTTTPSATYTSNWVNGVASSGTFVMNSAASWNTGTTSCSVSTYPCNWTVKTAAS